MLKKVAVLFGGKSAEREISIKTGQAVIANLDCKKYQILPVEVKPNGRFTLPPKIDLVFLGLHGPYGEDGTIQGMLEMLGISYTGSGVLASALGMDKIMSRQVFSSVGLTVPKSRVFTQGDGLSAFIFDLSSFISFPCVVKPHNQGSSVGVSIVKSASELGPAVRLTLSFPGAKALIEEYLDSREITCGILGNSGQKPYCLPLTEIKPNGKHKFFDWEAKYTAGESEEITPPTLGKDLTNKVKTACLSAYESLGCRGYARVDTIVVKDQVYILEINTLPGMTATSLIPQQAKAAGLSFSELLDKIIAYSLVP
ncbi:MAG: D-alanine--D-alanine ligase [bacterium]|nr:D-alanine--D-alanine ligase [bacterium]